jgi:hypothetical protein
MRSTVDWSKELTASLITPPLRRAIADLNTQFLEARIATLQAVTCRPNSIPAMSHQHVEAVAWMARCPFTLFELRMSDPSIAMTQVNDMPPITAFQPYFEDQALAQAVLILGSQLAGSARLTLAMVLGPSPVPHAVVRNTPVTQMPSWLKSRHLLRVRWLEHPHFWRTLFAAGLDRDAEMLERACCLGMALLVGDMLSPDQ